MILGETKPALPALIATPPVARDLLYYGSQLKGCGCSPCLLGKDTSHMTLYMYTVLYFRSNLLAPSLSESAEKLP